MTHTQAIQLQLAELKIAIHSDYQFEIPDALAPFCEPPQIAPTDATVRITNELFPNLQADHKIFEANFEMYSTAPLWQTYQQAPHLIVRAAAYETRKFPVSDLWYETNQHTHYTLGTNNQESSILKPFHNPIDSLLYTHILHNHNALMIHASCVEAHGKGYLFAGFSGVGKSTMAKLWEQQGATIINDDRILLRKHKDQIWAYNSPMPYPTQPRKTKLSGIFLLEQAPQNEALRLTGITAKAHTAAFCIQHNFSKHFTTKTYQIITDLFAQIPIFILSVYPDKNIVEFVKKLI
ncbi:MAG: hypothetical protein RIS47_1962 [Bacteroidota bacterium]